MQTHKISWKVGTMNQLPDQLSFLRLNTEEPTSKDLSLPLKRIPEPGHKSRPVHVRGSSHRHNTDSCGEDHAEVEAYDATAQS